MSLLRISYNICPTIYVNKQLSRLTHRRAPSKGSNSVVTRNRGINQMWFLFVIVDYIRLIHTIQIFTIEFSRLTCDYTVTGQGVNIVRVILMVSMFRDRHSSVIEVILVLTQSHWWDKTNIPRMECFKNIFCVFCMSVIFKFFTVLWQTNS